MDLNDWNLELSLNFINNLFDKNNIELVFYIYLTKVIIIYSFIKLSDKQRIINPKEKLLPKKEWFNLLLPIWGEIYLFIMAFKYNKNFLKLNEEYGGFDLGINLGFYKTKLILYSLSIIAYFISLYMNNLQISYYSQSAIVILTIWIYLSNQMLEKTKFRIV